MCRFGRSLTELSENFQTKMNDHPWVSCCKWGLRILFRVLFFVEYRGLHNIPASGPALIVPNHQSYLDPLLVGAATPRSVRYMAMKQLFAWPLAARFLAFYGAFPVTTRTADKGAIKSCIRFLRAGELVMIFPEGGRSPDGCLQDFFLGFARIALLERTPIVPVTVAGAHRVWPPQNRFPRPGKIRLTFHPPIDPADFPLEKESRARQIAQKIRETISEAL
jgi:1-acyl-sn-glycerol-3-phosphate acyltransferase